MEESIVLSDRLMAERIKNRVAGDRVLVLAGVI